MPVLWRRMNIQGSWNKHPWHIVAPNREWSICRRAQFTAARMQDSNDKPTVGRVCKNCLRILESGNKTLDSR